jgi:hypothetical protein
MLSRRLAEIGWGNFERLNQPVADRLMVWWVQSTGSINNFNAVILILKTYG